ncbi:hypothetical protein AVEN_238567-1 [Araneus ventricosus]|uniref:Uncharacterized protein n=1 Tax=Araneus ventricosus TaxID=182803 RepID=A0A4Y2UVD0_ARAVE|nr:hypothetical protein AVEN_187316-1 [Araneus ventricosus]GBO16853.1 hypothetical protein AVEN_238567-1 [Araneus ventricosus]
MPAPRLLCQSIHSGEWIVIKPINVSGYRLLVKNVRAEIRGHDGLCHSTTNKSEAKNLMTPSPFVVAAFYDKTVIPGKSFPYLQPSAL